MAHGKQALSAADEFAAALSQVKPPGGGMPAAGLLRQGTEALVKLRVGVTSNGLMQVTAHFCSSTFSLIRLGRRGDDTLMPEQDNHGDPVLLPEGFPYVDEPSIFELMAIVSLGDHMTVVPVYTAPVKVLVAGPKAKQRSWWIDRGGGLKIAQERGHATLDKAFASADAKVLQLSC